MNMIKSFTALSMLLASSLAMAHTGDAAHGLLHGLMHPFTGLDHLLGIILIGVLAARLEKQHALRITGVFVLLLTAGFWLGTQGLFHLAVEGIILTSLLVLSLVIWKTHIFSEASIYSMTALFGLAHGMAHGAIAANNLFGLGMVIAAGILLVAGFVTAKLTTRKPAYIKKQDEEDK